jgi:hypothetical protein
MMRHWVMSVGLVALAIVGYSPNTAQAVADPDAVGTVTITATGVKAAPNDNKITVSGQNTVNAAQARAGWRVGAAANTTTVYGVGTTTKYTILLAVTHGNGGAWTAESLAVANETYDIWAVTTFDKPAPGADTQNVGSAFASQAVNKNQNPITWIIGGDCTYTNGYPARSGGNAFITGKGTYSTNQGFKIDPGLPLLFTTIPVDGGVVRGTAVAGNNGNWESIALPVPSALNYNTYFSHAIQKDLQAQPPPPQAAVPHVLNVIAKNK